jgi:CDP-diacylglycerol--glycerol-3-phosphate 3-phosphatidyltransferase
MPESDQVLAALRLRGWVYAGSGLVFLVTMALFLYQTWQPDYAFRWLAQAGITILYVWLILWHNLPQNFRKGENILFPDLGVGNILTLFRGLLAAGLAGFLFSPWPGDRQAGILAWLPAGFYLLACISDFLDGTLARLTDHATRLGEILDMEYDSLGVLVSVLLVVFYGQAPAWFLLIAAARYLFIGGLWLRRRRGLPVYDLPQSIRRRVLAGMQMGFLAFLLMPVFRPPGTLWVATVFGVPLLIGFLWDWLAVSGVIRPSQGRKLVELNLAKWSAFTLRVVVVGLMIFQFMARNLISLADRTLVFLFLAVLFMLTFGLLGRVAAFLGLMILGTIQMRTSLEFTQFLLGMGFTGLLILGTGPFSLWAPEDLIIFRRIGEEPEPSPGKVNIET